MKGYGIVDRFGSAVKPVLNWANVSFEFVYLLTCGRRSLVSETQNEIVVS